jgi:hypothetical protein
MRGPPTSLFPKPQPPIVMLSYNMPKQSRSSLCSPMPNSPESSSCSSSHGRSLSQDKSHSHEVSRTSQMTSKGKHCQEHSPSQQHPKCQRKSSCGRWITHPFLPLPVYSTSSHKGKECQTSPAPIRSILPYEDIHTTELVMGPSIFKTI